MPTEAEIKKALNTLEAYQKQQKGEIDLGSTQPSLPEPSKNTRGGARKGSGRPKKAQPPSGSSAMPNPEVSPEFTKKLQELQNELHLLNEQKSSAPQEEAPQNIPLSTTIGIIRKMEANRAFIASADQFGKAIAERVLADTSAKPGRRVNFEDSARKVITFKQGSYALIYSGASPKRQAPFLWALDQQTRRTWAVFRYNDFYGYNDPVQPWKRLSTPVIVTPFNYSSEMVDSYGESYLAKFDQATQFQIPLHYRDTTTAEEMRKKIKDLVSAALTLWMDLQQYTKPKTNWRLIGFVGLLMVGAVVLYLVVKSHPHLLSGLGGLAIVIR